VTAAAREPKPSAWPGVDKASEGHFPNRRKPRDKFCFTRIKKLVSYKIEPSLNALFFSSSEAKVNKLAGLIGRNSGQLAPWIFFCFP
jgi:hypothetical protein